MISADCMVQADLNLCWLQLLEDAISCEAFEIHCLGWRQDNLFPVNICSVDEAKISLISSVGCCGFVADDIAVLLFGLFFAINDNRLGVHFLFFIKTL